MFAEPAASECIDCPQSLQESFQRGNRTSLCSAFSVHGHVELVPRSPTRLETIRCFVNAPVMYAYSGDLDRLFRPNVTGDSAGSALWGFITPIGHVPSTAASFWSVSSLLVSRRSRRGV